MLIVGRTQPNELVAIRLTGAITGQVPDTIDQYDTATQTIRMADGTTVSIQAKVHPNSIVFAILQMIREDELIQSIGRGRGVNRTADNPLHIDIMVDFALPVTVDKIVPPEGMFPDRAEMALETKGILPMFGGEAARINPEQFASRAAHRAWKRNSANGKAFNAIVKGGFFPIGISYRDLATFSRTGLSLVRYRRKGVSGRAIPAIVADANADKVRAILKREIADLDPDSVIIASATPAISNNNRQTTDRDRDHSRPHRRDFIAHQVRKAEPRPRNRLRSECSCMACRTRSGRSSSSSANSLPNKSQSRMASRSSGGATPS